MFTFTAHIKCVSAIEERPVAMCEFVIGFELRKGSVDTVCDMSNRHVSHGQPMDGCCATCIPTFLNWVELHDLFILLLVSDLSTLRLFLQKQTQLKCVKFEQLYDTMDVIDTVKVLKCYTGIATWFAHFSKSLSNI